MKNFKKALVGLAAAAVLTSCSYSAATPGWATSGTIGSKTGVAEKTVFLNLNFGDTDLSQTTAAKNGGITKIATVDFKVSGSLFKTTYTTTVTGE